MPNSVPMTNSPRFVHQVCKAVPGVRRAKLGEGGRDDVRWSSFRKPTEQILWIGSRPGKAGHGFGDTRLVLTNA